MEKYLPKDAYKAVIDAVDFGKRRAASRRLPATALCPPMKALSPQAGTASRHI